MKVKKTMDLHESLYYVKNTDLIQQTNLEYLYFFIKTRSSRWNANYVKFYSKRLKNQLHSNTLNMKVKKTMDLHEILLCQKYRLDSTNKLKILVFFIKTRSSRWNANYAGSFLIRNVKKTMDLLESLLCQQCRLESTDKNAFFIKTRSSRSNANHGKFETIKESDCTLIHE